jgi:hypothetical protein
MPPVWHTRIRAGAPEADRLLDAYLDCGGLVRVCGEWWELFDCTWTTTRDGVAAAWAWTLVRRAVGQA